MATAVQTPFGHSLPPEGAHTITFHVPKWESAIKFREGDMSLVARLKSIYPRFMPFGPSAKLTQEIGGRIKIPQGRGLVGFLSPQVWHTNREHAVSEFRKEKAVKAEELKYHVVEIDGIRLYLVEFPVQKVMGAIFMWQHGGLGFSTRLGEHLLSKMDSLEYLGEFPDGANPPPPTYLPDSESHELLRKRISGLLARSTAQEYSKQVQPNDIYLYQSGMAAILRCHEAIVSSRPHPVAVFGGVFHSTWHLFEESPGGLKHYGKADENDLDEFEKYLEEGGKCSYAFTEFPSNPILVSTDLIRLRKLADKYGFWIVIDDTLSSFCNIDVLAAADIIMSSLTKSFSGYADLIAGSLALNPNMASYDTLKSTFAEAYHNEFFEADAKQLFKNSDDYLERSAILNRNAATLSAYFQGLAEDPETPVAKVCYPPYAPGSKNLLPFLRKPSPGFPKVGYGCLFSVEFRSEAEMIAFYDNLALHNGPHLGAHLTLAMPYNAMIYGKDNPEYHASYGMNPNQIRFSAGLEDEPYLLDVCKRAIACVKESGDLDGKKLTEQAMEQADGKAAVDPLSGKPAASAS
ncbi:hypothetical protein E8E14_010888 [Neopestalotiopsis sp. 37M]|nr:hypothetical protein E8E14_010888 [Neopestalotiopsis sp. 37M]